jgi:hypothetical protein
MRQVPEPEATPAQHGRLKPPAPRPCVSCPYRCDVPSGVWSADEYAKLPRFDGETWEQDPTVFQCHQQDGRLCAGWVAVHDMEQSMGLRIAVLSGLIDPDDVDMIVDYTTDVPVFRSGTEAATHGLRDLENPGDEARAVSAKLARKPGMNWR